MLIDYLRYQAFSGRLQGFFEEGLSNYVDPEQSTGQHLRFAPDWIDSHWGSFGYRLIEGFYDGQDRRRAVARVLHRLGLTRFPNPLTHLEVILGERPPTYKYEDGDFPRLEIIIDIDPKHWSERYSEPRSYEDTPIIYRRSPPARANFRAGDRLVDKFQKRGGYGTLCGLFQTEDEQTFGLTCGHVTRDRGECSSRTPVASGGSNSGLRLVRLDPPGTTRCVARR